jgi:hypothetical protein
VTFRAALIMGLIIPSGEALASADSAAHCAGGSVPKLVVAAHHGRFIDLDVSQWQFLRGIYAMNPRTPPGLPYGDRAVLARLTADLTELFSLSTKIGLARPWWLRPTLVDAGRHGDQHGQAQGGRSLN